MSRQRVHPYKSTPSCKLRIIVIGNSGVGKSSIVSRFIDSDFDCDMIGTVGINFKNKTLNIDGVAAHLQVWDTAGEERFWSITPSYCRNADGVILIYDITDSKTFDGVQFWSRKVNEHSPNVQRMLLGNKLDMDNERVISEDSGKEAAERMGSPFFEVSAMTGHNIDQAFMALATVIVKKKELFAEKRRGSYPRRISIEDEIISVGDDDDDEEGSESATNKSSSCCGSTP